MTKSLFRTFPAFAFLSAGTLLAFALAVTAPAVQAQPGTPVVHNDMTVDFAGSWTNAAPAAPPAAVAPVPAPGMPQWSLLVLMVLSTASAFLRARTLDTHWFHTSQGLWAVSAITGVLDAISAMLEQWLHGGPPLTWWALAFGCVGALLSAVAQWKPTKRDPDVIKTAEPPKEPQ